MKAIFQALQDKVNAIIDEKYKAIKERALVQEENSLYREFIKQLGGYCDCNNVCGHGPIISLKACRFITQMDSIKQQNDEDEKLRKELRGMPQMAVNSCTDGFNVQAAKEREDIRLKFNPVDGMLK